MIRFFLVTIKPRKYITTSLTLVSTGVYSFDCSNINFEKVEVDGVSFSQLSQNPTGASVLYSYYYDDVLKKITMRIDATDITNKKNFIITHVIGLTNETDLYFNIDPDSPNTRNILFESRLISAPSFTQSQENNLNGMLSFSSSNIEVSNQDRYFNQFFSSDDSFKSSDLTVWRCDNTTATRRVVYKGSISSVSIGDNLTFGCEDFLNKLDNVFYSNGTYSNSIISGRSAGTLQDYASEPIRRVYGRNSYFKYKFIVATTDMFVRVLDGQSLPKAYCVGVSNTISVTTNRNWETAILEDRTTMEETYTVGGYYYAGTGAGYYATGILISGGSNENFSIGDTVIIGANIYARVLQVISANEIQINYITTVTNGATIKINKVSALILTRAGVETYLYYGKDFIVNTPTGDNPIMITLNNNFEANYGISAVDPNACTIGFKVRNTSGRASYSHAEQIKKLILTEFTSNDIESSTFASAGTNLALDLCYTVPDSSGNFLNKRDLLQKMLESSFGYLYLNDNFKICYGNFKTPTSTNTITDTEIKKNSISATIDFNDTYYSISFKSNDFEEVHTIEANQSSFLNKTNKQREIVHLCDVVSYAKPLTHFKNIAQILTMKRVITQLSALEFPLRIGDEKVIDSGKKIGNSASVVLSVEETDKEATIRMSQMETSKGNMRLIYNGYSQGNI